MNREVYTEILILQSFVTTVLTSNTDESVAHGINPRVADIFRICFRLFRICVTLHEFTLRANLCLKLSIPLN